MINLTYEQIVEKVTKEANISKQDVELRVEKKLKDLSDLISREGAAHIVANELNVKLFEPLPTVFKVKDLMPGFRSVILTAKVITIYPVREFSKDGRTGRVASLLVGDETGIVRIAIWDENIINSLSSLKEQDIIKVRNAYIKENNGFKEVHLGNKSQIQINPIGENIKEVLVKQSMEKKAIKDLKENDFVKIFGTLIQIFEPKFYEICPECGSRAKPTDNNYVCAQHGKVNPKYAPIVNTLIDDGTGVIRVVYFRNQAEELLNMLPEEVLALKDSQDKFEPIKNKMLLKQVMIDGKVTRNQMFDRLEMIARKVAEPDPVEMLKETQ